ncbi:MAG: hypothetical protein DRN08_05060, partial [Thermoplasmata archaeon]
MRSFLPIIVVVILVLSGLGAAALSGNEKEQIKKEIVTFSRPIITEKEQFAAINLNEATAKLMEPGKPMIPKYTKVFTFPFGTKIKNVDVTFSEELSIELTKLVIPAPERQIVSTLNIPTNTKNKVVSYSDIEIYPFQKYNYKTGAGIENGKHVIFLTVNINPIQYSPSENLVYYSKDATIKIIYEPPEKTVNFPNEYDFLIITPSEFKSAIQPLADYKNEKNVKTIITTLDEIPDVGVDKQESIKYYIKDAIENWGITYLLLVGGGVKDNEIFPVRYAYIPSGDYENSFPSDLYYADIYNSVGGFSSWDADGDGRYAEIKGSDMSEVDMYPDVYMARIPANTPNELSLIVDKILNYYKHNKMLNTIVQVGGDTFPGDPEGINEGEFANSVVLNNLPGYTSTRLWASEGQITKNNIAAAFRAGVDFADFSGHGSPVSWATHPPEDDSIWLPEKTLISPYNGFLYIDFDVYFINNGYKLPAVVFNACSTSKFSYSDTCLSYKVLKKPDGGGIASFGASGIGYGSYGTHEVERVWGWMEVHLIKEMYNTKVLGKSWANALNLYINSYYPGEDWDMSDYKTVLEVALFGDPTLAIQDGEDPKTRYVSIEKPVIKQMLEKLINYFPQLE